MAKFGVLLLLHAGSHALDTVKAELGLNVSCMLLAFITVLDVTT